MGYQNKFSAGPGSTAVLRKRGAEIEKIMEASAREGAITWLRSGGAVAVETRRRCMRSLLHEIFDEGAWLGKAVRRREMSVVRCVGWRSLRPSTIHFLFFANHSETQTLARRNARIAR